MKSIRNIAFAAILTIGAFSAVTYTSCNKDECKDVVCQNGGTCTDGVCACSTGYEGTNCQTKSTDKFLGTWTAVENCSGNSNTYQVTITADPSAANKVLVANLGDYGCTTGGIITWSGTVATTTLTINDDACGYQMTATCTYANGEVDVNYSATYLGVTDNCTATLSK